MHAPPLRLIRTVTSRKLGQPANGVLWRALSTSPVCREEEKTASEHEPERQKGIPLAFELGGVSIDNSGQRLTLAQKLAARSGTTLDVPSDTAKGSRPERRRRERGSSPPRRLQDGRGEQRPRLPKSSPGQRTGTGQRPAWDEPPRRERPTTSFQPEERRPRSGYSRPAQLRGAARPQVGNRDNARRTSPPAKAKPKSAKATPGAKPAGDGSIVRRRTLIPNPEVNDYPDGESIKRPMRRYDENGLLLLQGYHQQINPVIRPTLPKLPTPSARPSPTPVTSTLQVLSYLDRAPEGVNAQQGNDSRDVVDNATRALSRVRDLGMPRRRDALQIVEKLTRAGGGVDKRSTASS